jgi:rRNA maturation protein Nop10
MSNETVPSIIKQLGFCPECGAKAHNFTPRDKSGTDYADLHDKWRRQRQDNANLQRAHNAVLAELANLKAAQP